MAGPPEEDPTGARGPGCEPRRASGPGTFPRDRARSRLTLGGYARIHSIDKRPEHGMAEGKIVWARWRLLPEGGVEIVATIARESEFDQKRLEFDSIEAASAELGASFGDVVERAVQAGSRRGRWRP